MRMGLILTLMLLAAPVWAQGWSEPARGTAERAALMDAIRPHAEWMLGAPVEFVVFDLRRSGDLAFASLYPQRPGGGRIDLNRTPGAQRGDLDLEDMDDIGIQVLYRKSGKTWVAVHWVIGAGDVWYAYGPICAVWRPVIPEACQGL